MIHIGGTTEAGFKLKRPVMDLSRLTPCSVGGLSFVTYGREINRNFQCHERISKK